MRSGDLPYTTDQPSSPQSHINKVSVPPQQTKPFYNNNNIKQIITPLDISGDKLRSVLINRSLSQPIRSNQTKGKFITSNQLQGMYNNNSDTDGNRDGDNYYNDININRNSNNSINNNNSPFMVRIPEEEITGHDNVINNKKTPLRRIISSWWSVVYNTMTCRPAHQRAQCPVTPMRQCMTPTLLRISILLVLLLILFLLFNSDPYTSDLTARPRESVVSDPSLVPSPLYADTTHLIIVPGHSVYKGNDVKDWGNPNMWAFEPWQRSIWPGKGNRMPGDDGANPVLEIMVHSFVQHIRRAISILVFGSSGSPEQVKDTVANTTTIIGSSDATGHYRQKYARVLKRRQRLAKSLLIFSGGQSRRESGPRSEGASYYGVAQVNNFFNFFQSLTLPEAPQLTDGNSTMHRKGHQDNSNTKGMDRQASDSHSSGEDFAKQYIFAEEYARDSYENVLFSISRFKEVTGHYPKHVTVVGYEYKRQRFVEHHRAAIHFPRERFSYIGIDLAEAAQLSGIDAPGPPSILTLSDANTIARASRDPFGCASPGAQKTRQTRNPQRRTAPYVVTAPVAVRRLLMWCGPESFPLQLPWEI